MPKSTLRLNQHREKYDRFLQMLELINNQTSFSSKVENLIEGPIINQYLVFHVSEIVQKSQHLAFVETMQNLTKLANQPQQFELLRKQLQSSFDQLCDFDMAFQNSVHNDLIFTDRDNYLSKDQSGWINGVDQLASRTIDDVSVFEFLKQFISFLYQHFPDLLNVDNSLKICCLLIHLKRPVETDLKHIANVAPTQIDDFFNLMMLSYLDEMQSSRHFGDILTILLNSSMRRMKPELLSLLKPKLYSNLLMYNQLTFQQREICFQMASNDSLIEIINELPYLRQSLELSESSVNKLISLFVSDDFNDIKLEHFTQFFTKIKIIENSFDQFLTKSVSIWMQLNKKRLFYVLTLNNDDCTDEKDSFVYENILMKIATMLNITEIEINITKIWNQILDKQLSEDPSFMAWLMLDHNHNLFCYLSFETVTMTAISDILRDPHTPIKDLFNIIVKLFLWAKWNERNLCLRFSDKCLEFVNLFLEKQNYDYGKSHSQYEYQQKFLKLLKQNGLQLCDVPLLEKWMGNLDRPAIIDGDQIFTSSQTTIIWKSNDRILFSTKYTYFMVDNEGYSIWRVIHRSDKSHCAVFDGHFFLMTDYTMTVYDMTTGKLLKQLKFVGHLSIDDIRNFREPLSSVLSPLSSKHNTWYFVTKESNLYHFTFDSTKMEFVFVNTDENFPKDERAMFFTFVGSNLYYGQRIFSSRVSFYSLTKEQIINGIQNDTTIKEIFPYGNALCYISKNNLYIIQNETQVVRDLTKFDNGEWHIFKNIKQMDNEFCFSFKRLHKSKMVLFFPNEREFQQIDLSDCVSESDRYLDDMMVYPTPTGIVFNQKGHLVLKTPSTLCKVDISPKILEKSNKTCLAVNYVGYHYGYHMFCGLNC